MKILVDKNLDYFEMDEELGFITPLKVDRPVMLDDVSFHYNFATVTSNPLIIQGTRSSNFTALSAVVCWDSMLGESLSSNMGEFHEQGWRQLKTHVIANTWLFIADPYSTYDNNAERHEAGASYRECPQNCTVWHADGLMLGGSGNSNFLTHTNLGVQFVKNPVVADGCAYQDLLPE